MRRLCKVLGAHPSGFYAWRLNPESKRAKEDRRLLVPIKESWLESGSVYGYRKVSDDLRELGEQRGINRAHRLFVEFADRSFNFPGARWLSGMTHFGHVRSWPNSLEKLSTATRPEHTARTVDATNRAMAGDFGVCGCQ